MVYFLVPLKFVTNVLFFTFDFIDIYFRLDFSDTPISFYSLLWTNFWYLFGFIFLVIIIIFFFTFWNSKPLHKLLIFSLFEISDLWNSNEFLFILNNKFISINFFLLNTINKFHPFIFYLSVMFYLIVFLYFLRLYFSYHRIFSIEFYTLKSNFWITLSLIFNLVSLYLGSWWALQEGTWGGWWNWDASETFGLLISLFILIITHSPQRIGLLYNTLFYFFLTVALFLFSYYLIQLNFELISHNFGIKFFFFFNNSLFYLELMFILLFFSITIINNKFIFINSLLILLKPKLYNNLLNIFFLSLNLILVISIILIISFNSLLSFFFWAYFGINISNYIKFKLIFKLIFSVTNLILFFFFNMRYTTFIFYFFYNFFNYNFSFLFCSTFLLITSSLKLLHLFIFYFFLNNLLNNYSLLSLFLIKSPYSLSICLTYLGCFLPNLTSVNSMFLDFINPYYFFINNSSFSFWLFYLPTHFLNSNYLFIQNILLLYSSINFSRYNFYINTYIETPYLINLNFILFLFLIFFTKSFSKNIFYLNF